MHRSLIALAGAASIGLVSVAATPSPANAWCVGCAIGAGIVGGLAAGAIVGSAVANSPYYYPPPPGYYYPPPPPGYYPPPPGLTIRRLLGLTTHRLQARLCRLRPHRPTLSWRPAVTGQSGKSGSKVRVIRCEAFRSAPDRAA